MGKIVGILLLLGGVAGCLHSWMIQQKERQMILEELIRFLQKSVFAMENEKIKIVECFAKYRAVDGGMEDKNEHVLEKTLHEIAKRLAGNTYPNGLLAWEEVFQEEEQNWTLDKETFEVVLRAGNGFFCRSREENICFLKKSIQELEKRQEKIKEKDIQERKVWVPVGMLGTVMIMILFI